MTENETGTSVGRAAPPADVLASLPRQWEGEAYATNQGAAYGNGLRDCARELRDVLAKGADGLAAKLDAVTAERDRKHAALLVIDEAALISDYAGDAPSALAYQLAKAREQLAAVTAERDRLARELGGFIAKHSRLTAERDQLAARVTELERDLAIERIALGRVRGLHAALAADLDAARARVTGLESALADLATKWDATAAVPGDVAGDPDAYDGTARSMWSLRARLHRNHAAALRRLAGLED
jgi:hypothetical protein